jgi:3-dehydroquinate synthetase
MVDAAIGGKTAINFDGKRNLIGTFNNPHSIIIFDKFLKSLSINELIDGYAEIIKYSLIMDNQLFKKIEKSISSLLNNLDITLMNDIIKTCINHKLEVVKQDQFDQGIRNILNFGHTVGHALESFYNFKLSHGKAVLYGIKVASYLSYQKQNISEFDYQRIINLIEQLRIGPLKNLDINKVLDYIDNDKKHMGNQLNYILLKKIGSAYIEKNYNKKNLILGLKIL